MNADLIQYTPIGNADQADIADTLELDFGGRGITAAAGAGGIGMCDRPIDSDDQWRAHAGSSAERSVDFRAGACSHNSAARATGGRPSKSNRSTTAAATTTRSIHGDRKDLR